MFLFSTHKRLMVFFLFLTALLLRLTLVPNPGFEADISFWKSWGLAPFDHGLVWSMYNTNNNYPAPFAYILWIMVKVYSLFADPHNFGQFWNNGNVLFLTLAKLPAILSDMGIACVLLLWGNKKSASQGDALRGYLPFALYLFLAFLYLFNPVTLMDGAWWGQVDSLGVFLFLLSFLCLTKGKPALAGAVYMLAFMTKLQNMIYGPLFFLLAWQLLGFSGLVKAVAGALLTFIGLNIEFFLNRDMGRVIESVIGNYDYFPLLSLNAYNLWWIIGLGRGMSISDKITVLGLVNAKTMGLLLFSSAYLMAILISLKNVFAAWGNNFFEDRGVIFRFFIGLVIVNLAFFLFQTESHDRYAFPAIVFLLFLIPFSLEAFETVKNRVQWWTTRTFRIFLSGYIVFSILYFVNLHNALIINYPQNGIASLIPLHSGYITLPLASIFIGLYVLFLFFMRKVIGFWPFLLSTLCLVAVLIFLNLPLITRHPVLLTRLTPIQKSQQFGQMVVGMPVGAAGPSKNWNRLSVQYSFYKTGIGTHAESLIVYDLNRQFSRFTTDMGIDTEAGSQGSVVFEIYGDGKQLFRSDPVKRFEYPRHADVAVKGVKRLELKVTDGGNSNVDDHADWLNPTLYP